MPNWSYQARSTQGELIAGRLETPSRDGALAELRRRELVPITLTQDRPPLFERSVSTTAMAGACRSLSDLLEAGVPLLRSLRLLAGGRACPALSRVFCDVADQVADGTPLADAMREFPRVFTTVQSAMIESGERGGFLGESFQRLADLLERQASLRARVIGNLIYPIILVVTGVGAVIYALVAFVPKFEPYFERIEVPAATHILLGLSAFIIGWWPLLLGVCLMLIAAGVMVRSRPATRRLVGAASLKLPVVAPLVRDLAVARFARMAGTLLGSGVPVLQSLEIARSAAGQPQLEDSIGGAVEAVRAGESMAAPLGVSGVFNEEMVEMLQIAEEANAMPRVMEQMAEMAERRVDRRLDLLLRLMEPALLLCVAAMVVFIFIALVLPMMRMGGAVQ